MRLIDADMLIRKICFRCKEGDDEGMCAEFCRFIAAIDATPTITAAPVVLCKECKYHRNAGCPMRSLHVSPSLGYVLQDNSGDNGFCHMGTKMDGKEE